jgi:hypothetical protein
MIIFSPIFQEWRKNVLEELLQEFQEWNKITGGYAAPNVSELRRFGRPPEILEALTNSWTLP